MIKLKRAVIHVYKCIEEGESFDVGKEITALMGKNEAGKTSVLEDAEDVYCITGQEGGSVIRALEEETDEETLMPIQRVIALQKGKEEVIPNKLSSKPVS